MEISLGSGFEAETQLLIARALNLGNDTMIQEALGILAEEEKMLTALSNRLKANTCLPAGWANS
ncbi:MAG: hypothetical protein IPI66_11550 [Chitinophagaceae bacterium]|nr:hypothetical protein [Chitinophagaceae bacterium]